jgi:hypothetical protein
MGIGSDSSSQPASQITFHLLILDRAHAVDTDISGVESDSLYYKAKHGQTGYLIALYKVAAGAKSATLPPGSAIVLDLVSTRKSTLKEFINSAAIKEFVTDTNVLARLRHAITLE